MAGGRCPEKAEGAEGAEGTEGTVGGRERGGAIDYKYDYEREHKHGQSTSTTGRDGVLPWLGVSGSMLFAVGLLAV